MGFNPTVHHMNTEEAAVCGFLLACSPLFRKLYACFLQQGTKVFY